MGRYEGEFVARFLGDGRTIQLTQAFAFIDGAALRWDVPRDAKVDGASIPRALWTLIGGPFEGKYRDASVIHDYFCDVRMRPWDAVHRMFYEAMVASGVGQLYARTLYAGVRLGGPRWSPTVVDNMAVLQARLAAARIESERMAMSSRHSDMDASARMSLLTRQYAEWSRRPGPQDGKAGHGGSDAQEVYHYQLRPEDLRDIQGIAGSGLSLDEIDGAVQQRTVGITPSLIGVEPRPKDTLPSGMPALSIGSL